jgi:co-chaperonin GroES (HSP10)
MRKFIPAGYRILVKSKPIEKEVVEKSAGGIITAINTESTLQRKQEAGTEAYVMHVGSESYFDVGSAKPWCKVGDLVVISKYSGVLIDMDDGDSVYRAINDKDIIGVFDGEELNG